MDIVERLRGQLTGATICVASTGETMIRIRNISGDKYDPIGDNTYEVGINSQPAITTFVHARQDGLSECLRKAADAVADQEYKDALAILQSVGKDE